MMKVENKSPTYNQKNVSIEKLNNLNADGDVEISAELVDKRIINLLLPNPLRDNGLNKIGFCYELNTNYYNLFVVDNETFGTENVGYFTIPKNKALTESITPELKSRYAPLSEEAIEEIKTFPAIFASLNHGQAQTDDEHYAYFGFVTDIKPQDNGIKICFYIPSVIPQQKLNEYADNFGIVGASMANELNQTHWTIKEVDLIRQLKTINVSVLAPT